MIGKTYGNGSGAPWRPAVVALVLAGGCGFEPLVANRFALNLQQSLLGGNDDRACGTVDFSPFVPDCPLGGVCFTQACELHNQCYSTCGAARRDCDQAFFDDMIRTCSLSVPASSQQFAACRWVAVVYWLAVDRLGQTPFEETQAVVCPPGGGDLPDVLGACCLPGRPPICGDLVSFVDCPAQAVFVNDIRCEQLNELFGGCPVPLNDACENARLICFGDQPDADLGRCEGEEEGERGGGVCSLSGQDCANGRACLPVEGERHRCRVETDNRLATTDGPGVGDACFESELSSFEHDVWFEYLAPCDGQMVIRMCDALTYDATLAIYGSNQADGTCICPTDDTLIRACNDDFCGVAATTSGVTVERVVGGACYTIRVGSWAMAASPDAAQRGVSEIDIGVFCDTDSAPDGSSGDQPAGGEGGAGRGKSEPR